MRLKRFNFVYPRSYNPLNFNCVYLSNDEVNTITLKSCSILLRVVGRNIFSVQLDSFYLASLHPPPHKCLKNSTGS